MWKPLTNTRDVAIGDLVLRGRSDALRAHEPCSEDSFSEADLKNYLEAFEKLEAEDPAALAFFAALVGKRAEDHLASFHLKRLLDGVRGARIEMK